jgi:hypothetical protein
MSQRIATFPFPPIEDVRSCCGCPKLPRGYCCWTLELDVEFKEEVPPLGIEVFIREVRETIAFY